MFACWADKSHTPCKSSTASMGRWHAGERSAHGHQHPDPVQPHHGTAGPGCLPPGPHLRLARRPVGAVRQRPRQGAPGTGYVHEQVGQRSRSISLVHCHVLQWIQSCISGWICA